MTVQLFNFKSAQILNPPPPQKKKKKINKVVVIGGFNIKGQTFGWSAQNQMLTPSRTAK